MSAPIEVRCPECQATLKLKNTNAVGRRVPCPKCSQPFVIELPADDGLEILDDFDELDEFDEFDEAEDFGDIDEASAKPKPAAKKKSSGKKVWIIVGSVLGVGILGVGGYFGAKSMGWIGGVEAVVAEGTGQDTGGGMPGGGMQGSTDEANDGGEAAPDDGGEAKPAEAKPAEAKPAEAKPAEAKPAEAKPAEAKPAEAKPAEAKPAEAKPAGQPGASGIAGGDAVDSNDDGSEDQAKFQGPWTVTEDSSIDKSMVRQIFTFQNNRLSRLVKIGQQPLQETFVINIKSNPRTFDWVQSEGTYLGLYQFHENSLKLTVALPGKPRPKAVNATGDSVLQLSLKNPQGLANALRQAVTDRELVVISAKGERISIQLNPDGTTRDNLGNESSSYSIKNLSVSWEIDGLINTLEFLTPTPKVGDLCRFQQKKKTDGTIVVQPVNLKVVEIKLKRKPATAIDGTWKIVSAVVSGEPSEVLKGRMLSFAEGTASGVVTKLDAIEYLFDYDANTKATPAKFTVFNNGRLLWTGIYRFQGDRLELCFVRGSKIQPPKDFIAKDIGHQLYKLEPVKTP